MTDTKTPYTPAHLKLWTMPDNYAGEVWPATYSSGFGQSRDSDILERSNFAVAWNKISTVSDRVERVSENHWAVGWVEWIAIPADDTEALKVADDLREAYEQYPVLDEFHYSELEQQDAHEAWANCYSVTDRLAYIRARPNDFNFRSFADLLGCVRGKYFAGDASELVR